MIEQNNVFQKIIEKPKQTVINLTTMIKSRIVEMEENRRQQREIYLTTPPEEGAPTIRYEDSNSGIFCGSGGAIRRNEFSWSPQENRWLQTNSKIVVISGGRF